MKPPEAKAGAPVWYAPSWRGPLFAAVIASEPWDVGDTPCVRLEQLPQEYCDYTKRDRRHVPAAALTHVFPRSEGALANQAAWHEVDAAVEAEREGLQRSVSRPLRSVVKVARQASGKTWAVLLYVPTAEYRGHQLDKVLADSFVSRKLAEQYAKAYRSGTVTA